MTERKKSLHVMVTPERHATLKAQAAQSGHSLTDFILGLVEKGKIVARISRREWSLLREVSVCKSELVQIKKRLNQIHPDSITIAMAEDSLIKIDSILSSIQNKK